MRSTQSTCLTRRGGVWNAGLGGHVEAPVQPRTGHTSLPRHRAPPPPLLKPTTRPPHRPTRLNRDTLQELLTITNYTRAAYGYVMAAGTWGAARLWLWRGQGSNIWVSWGCSKFGVCSSPRVPRGGLSCGIDLLQAGVSCKGSAMCTLRLSLDLTPPSPLRRPYGQPGVSHPNDELLRLLQPGHRRVQRGQQRGGHRAHRHPAGGGCCT